MGGITRRCLVHDAARPAAHAGQNAYLQRVQSKLSSKKVPQPRAQAAAKRMRQRQSGAPKGTATGKLKLKGKAKAKAKPKAKSKPKGVTGLPSTPPPRAAKPRRSPRRAADNSPSTVSPEDSPVCSPA